MENFVSFVIFLSVWTRSTECWQEFADESNDSRPRRRVYYGLVGFQQRGDVELPSDFSQWTVRHGHEGRDVWGRKHKVFLMKVLLTKGLVAEANAFTSLQRRPESHSRENEKFFAQKQNLEGFDWEKGIGCLCNFSKYQHVYSVWWNLSEEVSSGGCKFCLRSQRIQITANLCVM